MGAHHVAAPLADVLADHAHHSVLGSTEQPWQILHVILKVADDTEDVDARGCGQLTLKSGQMSKYYSYSFLFLLSFLITS